MTVEAIDIFSIYGILPNEWHCMYIQKEGLDSIVIQAPHQDKHYSNNMGKAKITKPCGEVCFFPVFKRKVLMSPGIVDICSLAPFSEYEALGYQVEVIAGA